MLVRLKRSWREFKALPPGKRFQLLHQRQAGGPAWVKPALIAGAVIALAIGIVLSVLPGPGSIFFALAAGLIAIESARVARVLDRAELAVRRFAARIKRRWSKRGSSPARR